MEYSNISGHRPRGCFAVPNEECEPQSMTQSMTQSSVDTHTETHRCVSREQRDISDMSVYQDQVSSVCSLVMPYATEFVLHRVCKTV